MIQGYLKAKFKFFSLSHLQYLLTLLWYSIFNETTARECIKLI